MSQLRSESLLRFNYYHANDLFTIYLNITKTHLNAQVVVVTDCITSPDAVETSY